MIQTFCKNHPDRSGIGQCVQCRTVICFECSTRYQGINYCVTCLKKIQTARQPSGTAPGIPWLLYVCALLSIPLIFYAYVLSAHCLVSIADAIHNTVDDVGRE